MYVGPAAAPQRAASFWPPEPYFFAAFFSLSLHFVFFQKDGRRSKEAVKVPEQGQEAKRQASFLATIVVQLFLYADGFLVVEATP